MIVAGDELGRTQKGNNNAYCQDNEISWINWKHADEELSDFAKKLIHFYKNHPAFSRRRWFKGRPIKGVGLEDIAWFLPEGIEMPDDNWHLDFAKSLAVYLNGKALRSTGSKGEQIVDDNFYIIFNAYHEALQYKLPFEKYGNNWLRVIDTAHNLVNEEGVPMHYDAKDTIAVDGRSVVVLKQSNF